MINMHMDVTQTEIQECTSKLPSPLPLSGGGNFSLTGTDWNCESEKSKGCTSLAHSPWPKGTALLTCTRTDTKTTHTRT